MVRKTYTPVKIEPPDGRPDGHGTGGNHQPIIAQLLCLPIPLDDRHHMVQRVDRLSRVLEQEADSDTSDLFCRAMGQPVPVGHFAAQVERQATDAVVGKAVSQNDRHLRGGIDLFRSQGGADACITSPDN